MVLQVLFEPLLERLHVGKRRVPAPFKLIDDEAVVWIRGIELLLRSARAIARCFKVSLQSSRYLIVLLDFRFACQHGCLNRRRLYDSQHFVRDRCIDRHATKGDAAGLAVVEPTAPTGVPQYIVSRAGVTHRQLMTATMAAQESSEQRLTISHGPRPLYTELVG